MSQAEAKQDQLNAILSGMAEGLIAINLDRQVILMNQASGALIRISPAEAQGKNLNEILILEHDGTRITGESLPFERAINEKNIITYTLLDNLALRDRAERVHPVSLMTAPLIEGGEVTGAILLFHDITREHDVDRAKTEFVSLASHQLKTPLSGMSWYAEALLNEEIGKLNDKQKEYVKSLYDSSQRMTDLVNSLLSVTRLESGNFTVEPIPLDACEFARKVAQEFLPKIKNKKIIFDLVCDSNLPKIDLDPKLFRITLENLLSNAIKYTSEAGLVTMALTLADQHLLIRVGDSGYGIPVSEHKNIFSKLYRAENIRTLDVDGTGLGLYIVKSVIDSTGGRVWFESREGKGTTFFVTIPLSGMIRRSTGRKLS